MLLRKALCATKSCFWKALRGIRRGIALPRAPLTTADDVWNYLRAHPDQFALAAWDVGDEANGVFHDADTAWPLASTVKIVPLALACHRLHSGEWSENSPIRDVERFYLPGTDGGAHEAAIHELGGGVRTIGDALTAMIEFSDNAATDALLFELGRSVVDRETSLLGDIEPPHPVAGTMLVALEGAKAVSVRERAWAIASILDADSQRAAAVAGRLSDYSARELLSIARHFDNRGTARAFAKLMERLFTDQSGRYELARQRLGWPLRMPHNRDLFRQWGAKGGSLPGTLSSAQFAETTSGRRRVVALFLHDLPLSRWKELSTSFAQQFVELEILNADNPRALVMARIGNLQSR
ncbi:MAG: serine hydrolase [Thauera sp.]|nr:serine hydrolase [Thauera sp.]